MTVAGVSHRKTRRNACLCSIQSNLRHEQGKVCPAIDCEAIAIGCHILLNLFIMTLSSYVSQMTVCGQSYRGSILDSGWNFFDRRHVHSDAGLHTAIRYRGDSVAEA